MTWEVPQAEIADKSRMADAHAKAAIHQAPDARHRTAGHWPSGSTVLKVLLLGVVAVIAVGWLLTVLNR